jgi:hypothetical protein
MKRIIQFDVNDIKDLISEKYNINPEIIKIEAWGPSQAGSYYSNGGCIFYFEEKYENSYLKESKE